MKTKYQLLLIILIITGIQAFGQISKNKKYVHLYSDSIIYGNNLEYVSSFFKSSHFLIDSVKIKFADVKFYNDGTNFYGSIKNKKYYSTSQFVKRTSKGKVNLYKDKIVNYYGYSNRTSAKTLSFYNVGTEELKEFNYKNLSASLSDNPESKLYLDMCKKNNNLQTSLQISGILVAFAGVLFTNNNKDYIVLGIGTIIIGAGSFGIGYVISQNKPKLLMRAIEVYNGE